MKKLVLLLMLLAGCSIIQEDDGLWSLYTIKQNRHWATPYEIRTGMTSTVRFQFKFHEDTRYENLGEGFESDWNKLGYIYDGIHPHTNNAVTFVWKWMDGDNDRVLWLGWYGYKDGVSPQENHEYKQAIGIIEPGKFYNAEIRLGDPVVMVVDGVEYITTLSIDHGVMLPPYFGGQATAPHDMRITLIVEKDESKKD